MNKNDITGVGSGQQEEKKTNAGEYFFWEINEKTGRIKILPSKVYSLLERYGIAKYYPEKNRKDVKPVIVLIKNNIIEPVNEDFLMTFCKNFVNLTTLADDIKSRIIDVLATTTNIFSDSKLSLLIHAEVKTVRDTKDASYFFFRNGVVQVTATSMVTIPYHELDGYVWRSNIKPYEIRLLEATTVTKNAVFMHFLSDITRKGTDQETNLKRLSHLFSLIGYLLHRYKSLANAQAVIIMDEDPTFAANGGTGKSLIMKAVGKVRFVVTEDGRNFDPGARFAFQKISEDVDLFVVDDAAAKFNFEKLFPLITENFPVEKKFKDGREIPFEDSPKIAVTTNYSINGVGGSYTRRKLEFEISGYYHDGFSPETKYNQTFFQSWDRDEWNLFHNLMFLATQFYLKHGIVLSEPLNLKRTHLINSTSQEFVDFANDNIKLNQEYNKKDLFRDFRMWAGGFDWLTQSKFTKWLKIYGKINDYEINERHSDGDYLIMFSLKTQVAITPIE